MERNNISIDAGSSIAFRHSFDMSVENLEITGCLYSNNNLVGNFNVNVLDPVEGIVDWVLYSNEIELITSYEIKLDNKTFILGDLSIVHHE